MQVEHRVCASVVSPYTACGLLLLVSQQFSPNELWRHIIIPHLFILDRQGVEYHPRKEVELVVPNASVRSNYAQAFSEYHVGQVGSANALP